MMALTGSHRSGKTTLAKAYAAKHGIPFVQTTASAVFRRMGLDPAVTYDFGTRLAVQEEILKEFDGIWAGHSGKDGITDRCPLDLLGYTMAEAIGDSVSEEDQERFAQYAQDCFHVTNKRFATVTLVQPGIELKPEAGKAVSNKAYIEHLNSLIFGLTVDPRLKALHFYIQRHTLDLDERLTALEGVRRRANYLANQALGEHLSCGGLLQ